MTALLIDSNTCLLIVDAQYGFMPGGGLPVAGGDAIVPVINRIAPRFANIVLTQDWHPADHVSFAINHPGKQPYETITLPYGEQVLWPKHCVQGTPDAALHAELQVAHAQLIIRKGFHQHVDSYSGFVEADRRTSIGQADAAVRAALEDAACAEVLWQGLIGPAEPVVRMRCADALEKFSRLQPAFIDARRAAS